MRYDAAIIGAGAEGLVAAALLGRAGLRVLVVERSRNVGGRACLREFHPGFKASPYADDIADMPADLFWALDLARFGAVLAPQPLSLARWAGLSDILSFHGGSEAFAALGLVRDRIVARMLADARLPSPHGFLQRFRTPRTAPWPGADLATQSLADAVSCHRNRALGAHLAALALEGRVADPALPGSALNLLAAGAARARLAGGPARLAQALHTAAQSAGVEFALGLEATDILRNKGKIEGLGLADGSQIEADRVVSTLDLKRTFLAFFAWNALPKVLMRRINTFRMAGATARVLLALDAPPRFSGFELPPGAPLHVAPGLEQLGESYQAWRQGLIAAAPPITLRVISTRDPSLAPSGGATVTATIGAVPFRPFDGAWTHEKREMLRQRALGAVESVAPGFTARVLAAEVVAPPDIEDGLGATEGDLLGGEVAGDQMLGCGPWEQPSAPRTPVAGLYLGGSNLAAGLLATGAAGAAAAFAVLADLRRGKAR